MDLSQMMDSLAIEPPFIGNWLKQIQERQADEPMQRRYHSAVIHKSSIYIYGGLLREQPEDHLAEQSLVYRYNFNSKIWSKIPTHFPPSNSFSYICAHGTAVFNNMMYLYGGKNYKTNEYIQGLWCLNLESYNWKKQEVKGYSPLSRQHAVMVLHQRSTLLMYGGRLGKENLNDFNIYRIDNKIWLQIEESSYDFKIACRLKPAICSQGDYLYFFGGERMIANQSGTKNVLMKDFYQFKLINRPMSSRPDVWVKEIITNYTPTERVASFVNIGDRYLMLWGGHNSYNGVSAKQLGFWLYNISEINWIWVALNSRVKRLPIQGFTINYFTEKCFIFGQYSQSKQQLQQGNQQSKDKMSKNGTSGFLVLSLQLKDIESKLSDLRFRPKMLDEAERECWECNQQLKCLEQHKFEDFNVLQEIIEEQLNYPYSAFGLLLDNSLLMGAKEVRVIFNHTFKEKYCLIQDNGMSQKLWSNSSQFINDLLITRTYVEENIDYLQVEEEKEDQSKKAFMPESPVHHPTNILNKDVRVEAKEQKQQKDVPNILNKETKEQKQLKDKETKDKELQKELKKRKRIAKQNAKKRKQDRIEFSRNIKLGAFRLGSRMLFICRYGLSNDNRRVFVIEKSENSSAQDAYRAYYYIYENGSLVDQNMDNAKRYIDEQYKAFFKIVADRKQNGNNFLFITNLREIQNEKGELQPELKESVRHNDIFNCQKKMLEAMEDSILWDSLDISLKTYLSLLYLKSDQMKISLTIGDHKVVEINNSDIFDKIDSLVKSERLIDLEPALDFEHCKIIEAYYNKTSSSRGRELNRKSTAFHFLNGVLFYHKNRLISRYQFDLGEISKFFKNKMKIIQQTFMMFGFIEIESYFAVNIFKTGFVRDDLLQQIYHRLKFVEKYAQNLTKQGKEDRRPPEDRTEPKKRFKTNEEGQKQAGGDVVQIE